MRYGKPVPCTEKSLPESGGILCYITLDSGTVDGLSLGLAQVLDVGVLDQLLGADSCAQAALCALGVVDPGQALLHGDCALGADLLTQTAADTADGTGTGGSRAKFASSTVRTVSL